MKIIGLTGGSGAGKTAVSASFVALGAGTVDADAVYRTLCAESREMLDALQSVFGDVLTPDGRLDRPKLAKIVFSDAEKLKKLNDVTFPYIRKASEARFMELAESGHAIILYDAPTLYQTGADTFCDAVIGVIASRETRIRRIMARDGISEGAAAARIDSQPDAEFYRSRCAFVIENDGTTEELTAAAERVWAELKTNH